MSTDFKSLLSLLIKSPSSFTPRDLQHALTLIFTSSPPIPPAQIASLLTALHLTHLDHSPLMLAAAAALLRRLALTGNPTVLNPNNDFIVDIVGTGGDGYDTFNVSTTAAIVAAGAGARVCKHGSRASTSSSGSADLLQSLGCVFPPPPSSSSSSSTSSSSTLSQSSSSTVPPPPLPPLPFTFLLAPTYHPSLALLAPVRTLLPFRTLFNLLGPLLNPARPRGILIGVPRAELGMVFARCLIELEGGEDEGGWWEGGEEGEEGDGERRSRPPSLQRALIVCGRVPSSSSSSPSNPSSSSSSPSNPSSSPSTTTTSSPPTPTPASSSLDDISSPSSSPTISGLDEISPSGPTDTWLVDLRTRTITHAVVHPTRDFGLPVHGIDDVRGGSPGENAGEFRRVLRGERFGDELKDDGKEDAPNPNADADPILDFILLNASALLVVAGLASDYREGVRMARESVRGGRAWGVFCGFREFTRR